MACSASKELLCSELCNSSSLHDVETIKTKFSSLYALNHQEFMYFLKIKILDFFYGSAFR